MRGYARSSPRDCQPISKSKIRVARLKIRPTRCETQLLITHQGQRGEDAAPRSTQVFQMRCSTLAPVAAVIRCARPAPGAAHAVTARGCHDGSCLPFSGDTYGRRSLAVFENAENIGTSILPVNRDMHQDLPLRMVSRRGLHSVELPILRATPHCERQRN